MPFNLDYILPFCKPIELVVCQPLSRPYIKKAIPDLSSGRLKLLPYICGVHFKAILQFFMYQIKVNDGEDISIETNDGKVLINGTELRWDFQEISDNYFHIIKGHRSITAEVVKSDYDAKQFTIKIEGRNYEVSLKDRMDLLLEKMGIADAANTAITDLKAPMPGLILDIMVEEGQEIKKGDQLMILEAMKMENVLKAPGDGVVRSIEVSKGGSVEKNQVLITF